MKFLTAQNRVKCVEFHPVRPWLMASVYSGYIYIWDFQCEELIDSFEATDVPIRVARFIARKDWIVAGSDDSMVRVFSYGSGGQIVRVHETKAHADYIRDIAVHPHKPYVLTASDDLTLKLWEWDPWQCKRTYEGHAHYVMAVTLNPRDFNIFASASFDRTAKVWQLDSEEPILSLEGHQDKLNCIKYCTENYSLYLLTGADDNTIKMWNLVDGSCIYTVTGHRENVVAIAVQADLAVMVSASEDCFVRFWNGDNHRLEGTLMSGLGRAWTVAVSQSRDCSQACDISESCDSSQSCDYLESGDSSQSRDYVAIGYDEGCVIIKLVREETKLRIEVVRQVPWNAKLCGDTDEGLQSASLPSADENSYPQPQCSCTIS